MKYGRYEVIELLGSGSMGDVYKAYDPQFDRNIALKVLKKDRVVSEGYVKRFMRGAAAVGRLSHGNIGAAYDIGQEHGTIYIAMELLSGATLKAKIAEESFGDLSIILSIAKQVAHALHYAHQNGVIHRDIKPENIVCSNNYQVKVTDFGIAHIDDPDGQQMTQEGEVLGTPYYMSPEQFEGRPVDGRSDLYSLGVILYELTTGQRPFQGKSFKSLYLAVTTHTVKEPHLLNPQVPIWLSRLIMTAMARDPGDRFSSCSELVRAIENGEQSNQTEKKREVNVIFISFVLLVFLAAGLGTAYYLGYLPSLATFMGDRAVPSKEQAITTSADQAVSEKSQDTLQEETTGQTSMSSADQADTGTIMSSEEVTEQKIPTSSDAEPASSDRIEELGEEAPADTERLEVSETEERALPADQISKPSTLQEEQPRQASPIADEIEQSEREETVPVAENKPASSKLIEEQPEESTQRAEQNKTVDIISVDRNDSLFLETEEDTGLWGIEKNEADEESSQEPQIAVDTQIDKPKEKAQISDEPSRDQTAVVEKEPKTEPIIGQKSPGDREIPIDLPVISKDSSHPQTETGLEEDKTAALVREATIILPDPSPPPTEVAMKSMVLNSRPEGAKLFIDGAFLGTTPVEITVSADKHEIELRLAGHGELKAQVDFSKIKKDKHTFRIPSL